MDNIVEIKSSEIQKYSSIGNVMSEISNRIKLLREEKNLSQTKLAALLAVKRHHVVDIESDKQRPPYETIIKYAEYFSVNSDWLLTGEGEKYAKPNTLKEPSANYGAGILERIDSRDEKIATQMEIMMTEIMKLSKEVTELKKMVAA